VTDTGEAVRDYFGAEPEAARAAAGGVAEMHMADLPGGHDLTRRQRQLLRLIEGSFVEYGQAPTVRELQHWMGIRNPNGITCHLRVLERKGYVTFTDQAGVKTDGKSRKIRLVGARIQLAIENTYEGRRLLAALEGGDS
jgi:hypothetical protein